VDFATFGQVLESVVTVTCGVRILPHVRETQPSDELQEAFEAAVEACRAYHDSIRLLPTSPDRCVYVEAVPGIGAVRVGRTANLLQRVRNFEHRHLKIEVILVGECTAYRDAPERAETKLFSLLDEIHLRRHNPNLYRQLPTYDWFLPDRRKLRNAFSRLCGADMPLLTRFYPMPLFERLTRFYL
jgi:hypothetical protein